MFPSTYYIDVIAYHITDDELSYGYRLRPKHIMTEKGEDDLVKKRKCAVQIIENYETMIILDRRSWFHGFVANPSLEILRSRSSCFHNFIHHFLVIWKKKQT